MALLDRNGPLLKGRRQPGCGWPDQRRAVADAVAELDGCRVSQLGLRFDRVSVRVLDQLRDYMCACGPEGVCVIVTLTAPIRTPKQTVSELQRELRTLVEADRGGLARCITLAGGHAQLRLVDGVPPGAPKLLGFVHNSKVSAARISGLAERWLRTQAWRSDSV